MDDLHDHEAEKAVIGALLINTGVIPQALGILRPGDFHEECHGWILQAMQELCAQGHAIDYMTVVDRLASYDGRLAELGGAPYLTGLMDVTPTSMNWESYARIVHRLAALRKLMACAGQIAKLAYASGNEHVDEIFARAHRLVESVTPQTSDAALLLWLDSLDAFFSAQLDRSAELDDIEKGTAPARVSFPWSALGRFVSYLRPGMLAVIAAETSVGKTTAMECCAEFWAREGLHVAFFHLELSHRFMLERRMVRQSGEALRTIESGEVTGRMRDADVRMREWRGAIHYIHCPGWSASRIMQQARTLHAKGRCDVLVIDYFQKMRLGYRRGQNKADAMGNAIEGIKTGLEQMGIPGMVGSQVNRSAGHAQRKEGKHIRGSGEIEEKANLVLMLDRQILIAPVHDSGGKMIADVGERSPQMRVRADKNTAGPTGDCKLVMNGARFLILDLHAQEAVQ